MGILKRLLGGLLNGDDDEFKPLLDEINADVFATVLNISSEFSTNHPSYQFSASFDRSIDGGVGQLVVVFKVARFVRTEPAER